MTNVWIIGASHGIGAELAKALAQDSRNVALSVRDSSALDQVHQEMAMGTHIVAPLDVTDNTSIQSAYKTLLKTWPQGVDTVIYVAGVYEPSPMQKQTLDTALKTLDINLGGSLRVLDAVLPGFIKRDKGHIVLFGSVAGYSGLPNSSAYGISKAGIIHMAECLKIDLAHTQIKVQLVDPGFVQTRLTDKNDFEMPDILTPEAAAQHVVTGLKSTSFEIFFPKRFCYILKFLRLLPYSLYFWMMKKFRQEKP